MRRGTLQPLQYQGIQPRKLAVITCHFNFAGYTRPRANCRRFLRSMWRQDIPIYGVELVMPGEEPLHRDCAWWKVLRVDPARHILWQKEALLNQALSLVPREYNAIAWIDADLEFNNPHWVAQTEQALTMCDVVQPFSTAVWTGEDGSRELSRWASTHMSDAKHGHVGFAWAARREVLDRAGGLFTHCLLGNGDTLMALGFFGQPLYPIAREALGTDASHYDSWRQRVGSIKTGTVPGDVWHEYHGTRENRRYAERVNIVKAMDCGKAVELDMYGLLSWTDEVPESVREEVANYFIGRQEDA